MDRDRAITLLREAQTELQEAGVRGVSLFGSVARGEGTRQSDVDLAIQLQRSFDGSGLAHLERVDLLKRRFRELLGCDVDVVEEPVDKARLQQEIDRDRVRAF